LGVGVKILGIDPALSKTGLCFINTDSKEVVVNKVEREKTEKHKPVPFEKDFRGIFGASVYMTKAILDTLSDQEGPVFVISEIPPPFGSFAAGLYALDVLLLKAVSAQKSVKAVYTLSPTFLDHVHETRKNTTKWHSDLGKKLLDIYAEHGYKISYRRGESICSDEGAATVFATRLFVKAFEDSVLAEKLVSLRKNLSHEKEKLLFVR
jgi:hypothetical protein